MTEEKSLAIIPSVTAEIVVDDGNGGELKPATGDVYDEKTIVTGPPTGLPVGVVDLAALRGDRGQSIDWGSRGNAMENAFQAGKDAVRNAGQQSSQRKRPLRLLSMGSPTQAPRQAHSDRVGYRASDVAGEPYKTYSKSPASREVKAFVKDVHRTLKRHWLQTLAATTGMAFLMFFCSLAVAERADEGAFKSKVLQFALSTGMVASVTAGGAILLIPVGDDNEIN